MSAVPDQMEVVLRRAKIGMCQLARRPQGAGTRGQNPERGLTKTDRIGWNSFEKKGESQAMASTPDQTPDQMPKRSRRDDTADGSRAELKPRASVQSPVQIGELTKEELDRLDAQFEEEATRMRRAQEHEQTRYPELSETSGSVSSAGGESQRATRQERRMKERAVKMGRQYVNPELQNQRQAISDAHGIDVRNVDTNEIRLRQ